jgi:hypothetical protein
MHQPLHDEWASATLKSMIDEADNGPAWGEFDLNRSKFLQLVADHAEKIATRHLTAENFHRLIKIAYDGNIISAAQLGEFGRRDPTTASRWINRHSTPDSFAQEAILKRIAAQANEQAEKARARLKVASAPPRRRTGSQ